MYCSLKNNFLHIKSCLDIPAFTGPSALTVNVMKNINDSSIVVQWDALDDSLTTTYTITWATAGGGLQVATLIEQTSYTITGLTLDTVYITTVTPANMCGSGPEFSFSIILSTNTTSTTSSISPTVIASTNPMTLSMPTLISSSTATTTALTTATNSTIITVVILSTSITPTRTHITSINPITTTATTTTATTTTTTATTTATTTSIIVNDTTIAADTTTTTTNPTNSADVTSKFKHNSYIYCDIIHVIGTSLNSNM